MGVVSIREAFTSNGAIATRIALACSCVFVCVRACLWQMLLVRTRNVRTRKAENQTRTSCLHPATNARAHLSQYAALESKSQPKSLAPISPKPGIYLDSNA